MKNLFILDLGSGNLRSIYNAFKRIEGVAVKVTNCPIEVAKADYLVMPGQGAFDKVAVNLFRMKNLVDAIMIHIKDKNLPFLGVCVGMQLLSDVGYENGVTKGMSLVSGEVKKIYSSQKLILPHMGWNEIIVTNESFKGFDKQDFYFVHSYYFDAVNASDVVAYCNYGIKFPCILQKENILATQFHPEKSGAQGAELLKHFIRI